MLKEFKEFVNQGNALDLAVGVMIGAAFGKIVNSIVNDLIMPIVSLPLGGSGFHQHVHPAQAVRPRASRSKRPERRRGHRLRRVPQQRHRVPHHRVHDLPDRPADQQVARTGAEEVA